MSDFTLKLRTTAKQCFGSAGCNVTLRVILQVNGTYNFNPARTYDLRFQIIGDESGPLIDTLQLTGKRYTTHEEFISTSSEHVVPIVKIIGITPG